MGLGLKVHMGHGLGLEHDLELGVGPSYKPCWDHINHHNQDHHHHQLTTSTTITKITATTTTTITTTFITNYTFSYL